MVIDTCINGFTCMILIINLFAGADQGLFLPSWGMGGHCNFELTPFPHPPQKKKEEEERKGSSFTKGTS